ncbi:hypothetical protein BV25DRAFT_1145981 [Artomyces pyxidatus]|uniref:Uncharacterized protein n=1 Tax=Artomyces pyxidatus TaxID=48021 RepID=A0ACB8SCL2_9AGAM|nr:hypothetical protein BV25DRAFT_1145981 [Artomyces pyxidatus]
MYPDSAQARIAHHSRILRSLPGVEMIYVVTCSGCVDEGVQRDVEGGVPGGGPDVYISCIYKYYYRHVRKMAIEILLISCCCALFSPNIGTAGI